MQNVFLVRHTESDKNTQATFAARDGGEVLTPIGQVQARTIGQALATLSSNLGRKIGFVASSKSMRSMQTAELIAAELECNVQVFEGLASIGSGILAGATEQEAQATHGSYMRALRLYRAGLFNSYDIPEFEGKEEKRVFEARVNAAYLEITRNENSDIIVVSQRSPITAMLLEVARANHGYPQDFFGFVQLDLGRVSWIVKSETGSSEIKAVNQDARDLSELY